METFAEQAGSRWFFFRLEGQMMRLTTIRESLGLLLDALRYRI